MHQHEPASGKRKRLVPCSRSTSPCCRASCKGAPSPSPQARAVARACHAPWRQSDARAGATSSCSCPHTAIGRKFPRRAQRRRPRESGDASTRWVVLRGSARPRAGAREAVVHAVSIERLAALDLSLGKELRLFRLRGLRSKDSLQSSKEGAWDDRKRRCRSVIRSSLDGFSVSTFCQVATDFSRPSRSTTSRRVRCGHARGRRRGEGPWS